MAMLMNLTTILTAVSALALGGLLHIYIKNLRNIKSKFTIGLLIFAVLFLAQSLVSLYYYLTMMDYYSPEVEVHVFILTLLQTAAFLVLLKISWE
ncbi:hypothetical protein HYT53_00260 [Candidatus Woesearchaeota archaeon]|nr:hypothetical protein [Candidatus Woesearchaeota archaeon]